MPWQCDVRFRGARSPELPQPVVSLAVDGTTLAGRAATNDYQDLTVTAPESPGESGLTLTVRSSATFVPGPADRRELGVQVDRLACQPAAAAGVIVWPPQRTLVAAATAACVFGAAFGLLGIGLGRAIAATVLWAAAQALPLSTSPGPYAAGYESGAVWVALWAAAGLVVLVKGIELVRRQPLSGAAKFAVGFSACAMTLKLFALMHPMKLVEDALFHAHRLERVLAGSYYFTQGMPDGVQFPYAVALYVFAAPWAALTHNHIALLRIVTCACEIVAGGLLYVLVARTWKDSLVGALAVVLFNCVPLSYVVAGNANLTNDFGQSAALVAVVAASTLSLRFRHAGRGLMLTALIALALLSHVSTFGTLSVTLLAVAACYWLWGGRALRGPAGLLTAATFVAVLFSVVIYYGHFVDVYKTLARVRPAASVSVGPTAGGPTGAGPSSAAPKAPAATPLYVRLGRAIVSTGTQLGWPVVLLAVVGGWRVWKARARDRLVFALIAWGVAYGVFLAFGPARAGQAWL